MADFRHLHDKTNRFRLALDIQDAGNLKALARAFVEVVDDAMAETQSTTATWSDPAVRLFVSKFESLCQAEPNFGEAYNQCHERS